MTTHSHETLALRLGLASKSIPQISLGAFIAMLGSQLGEPLTEKKLRAITPKQLFTWLTDVANDIERGQANQAYAILMNAVVADMSAPICNPDKPLAGPKLRVAVSSNNEEMIDGHFGSCLRMLVYEVNRSAWQLVEVRPVHSVASGLQRTDYLVNLIEDCQLLATLSIGGPAAAKVTRADIHPIKQALPTPSSELLARVQQVLNVNPPPWIKKLLAKKEPIHVD